MAQLYLYNRITRTVCAVPGNNLIQQLRQELELAREREMNIAGMMNDLRLDSMDAFRERRRIERQLYALGDWGRV